MIVDYYIENFRSFGERVKFSMRADEKDKYRFADNIIKTGIKQAPYLVKSMVVYGANASGKTNIFMALSSVFNHIIANFSQIPLNQQPVDENFLFKFRHNYREFPNKNELVFIHNKQLWRYKLECKTNKYTHESLYLIINGEDNLIFSREDLDFKLNEELNKHEPQVRQNIRANILLLTILKFLGDDKISDLCEYFNDINSKLFIQSGHIPSVDYIYQNNDANKINKINEFLSLVDLGVKFKNYQRINQNININGMAINQQIIQLQFIQQTNLIDKENITADLNFNANLSEGTRVVFSYFSFFMEHKDKFGFIFADEFGNNLHRRLIIQILAYLNQKARNMQFIFTTHQDWLVDLPYLRADQICLITKDADKQSSKITRLHEITDENDKKLNRKNWLNYLRSGELGVNPRIDDLEFWDNND